MSNNCRFDKSQKYILDLAAAEVKCSEKIAQARANKSALMKKCKNDVAEEMKILKSNYENLYQQKVLENEAISRAATGDFNNKFEKSILQMKQSYETKRKSTMEMILERVLLSSIPEVHRNQIPHRIDSGDDDFNEITRF